jgi:hypothetical protein
VLRRRLWPSPDRPESLHETQFACPDGQLDADGTSHAVEVIERNAAAQRQIIEDLLDVSRIVTGKLRISTSELKTVDQECRRSFWCVYQRWPVP